MTSLLRFLSKTLPVETRVDTVDGDTFIILICEGVEIGTRRLNKRACCTSKSPCIGPVPIAKEHRDRFGIPAFVHISICYAEIEDAKAAKDGGSIDGT